MASYDYIGTKITGTSTTAKVFKKSGVAKAKVNDTYFNAGTGHVYKCTVKGKPEEAKWQYIRTDIAGPPTKGVTGMSAPARQANSRKMAVGWKIPPALTDAKAGDRATHLEIQWILSMTVKDKKGKKVKTSDDFLARKSISTTESSINLDHFETSKKTYTRNQFYPFTSRKLLSVVARVLPVNSRGGSVMVSKSATFGVPVAPAIANFTFNGANGTISTTIRTDAGVGLRERYDTVYTVTIRDRNGKTVSHKYTSTATSISVSYDALNYQVLTDSQYIKVTVKAYSRGYAGASSVVEKSYILAYPARATARDARITSASSTGRCTLPVSTNNSKNHPVDGVRLQYLANVEYATAGSIPGDAGWEDTEITDDAECTALTMPVADLIPDPGNYTWLRVKSWHAHEPVLSRYSNYVRVKPLEKLAPTAADDNIRLISAVPGEDGASVVVQLGWNASGLDDSTGTELTWSDDPQAWRATNPPDEYLFEWKEGPITSGGITYRNSAKVYIRDLEEGTKYFIKARRYLEGESSTTYSNYSNVGTCYTSETPESIVATCDRYVPAGRSLPVYWTLSGTGIQTAWKIVTSSGTQLAGGRGSLGSAYIPAERLERFADSNHSVMFTVQASTGSDYVISEQHTVTITERPTLAIAAAASLTAQPLSFGVTASTPCDLIVIVSSQGIGGQYPEGLLDQAPGDTVHSDIYTPAWTPDPETGDHSGAVTLPDGLDFWDGGNYTIAVTAIDQVTGLQSEEQTAGFLVSWAHQAPNPEGCVELTPLDVQEGEGDAHHQAVQIALTPPNGCYKATGDTAVEEGKRYYSYDSGTEAYSVVTPEGAENPSEEGWYDLWGDVYDIYRSTRDGSVLIGRGFPLECVTTDEYAPFGDDLTMYYRIAIRTEDGDVSFFDFEYVQDGAKMRFDWRGGSLELPYDLSIADKYKKDVEIRAHMDGSVSGYWNRGVERTASLSSNLIFLRQQTEIENARRLARYPGAVFVRLPDGSAYEADVQVSDLSGDGKMTVIAIDATEIGLTDEFALPSPYTFEEAEGEG